MGRIFFLTLLVAPFTIKLKDMITKRIFVLLICGLMLVTSLYAQNKKLSPERITKAQHFRKTIPLRDITPILPGERDRSWKDGIIRNEEYPEDRVIRNENALPLGEDPVWQDYQGSTYHRGPIVNFDGVGNVNGVLPPDTDGDVGPNHYFQMINLSFAIYDKSGNKLYGPVDNSTLWSGFIGPWTGTNDGDPILLYDEIADRWMASQFAINTSNDTYWQLMAISESGDPLGAYYQYAFEFPAFNDYPKYGVWPDAYYATFNMFGEWNRTAAAAFERDKMLIGDSTARMILFDLPESFNMRNMLPADFDGPPPVKGTPNYHLVFKDDTWGYAFDQLQIWEFVANWDIPQASTFEEVKILETEPFTSRLCEAPRWQCIPQPNTSLKLEAINDRLMHRVQYRNFETYSTMVLNHTVNADGMGTAGVRWYELRDYHDGNGWEIYQQGTYSPDDNSRWMASIAMNGKGTIALGFTISSDTIAPSVMYTGRTPGAPLGEMNLVEVMVAKGLYAQANYNRWGDYSMMSLDPDDDSTFWYTQEYSTGGWKTRICSLNFGPIQAPIVYVGPDTTICWDEALFRVPNAENYLHVYWTTSGDGFFPHPDHLMAGYLRGEEDIANGEVDLTLTVYGYMPGTSDSDQMTLYIDSLPMAFAGVDTMICFNHDYQCNGKVANSSSLQWSSSGDGSFNDPGLADAVYYPGNLDTIAGSVELFLTAYSTVCEDSIMDGILLIFSDCPGIWEHDVQPVTLSVYPNPSVGIFTVDLESEEAGEIEISILDARGQVLFNQYIKLDGQPFTRQFDMHYLEKGTYRFRAITRKGQSTVPFILQ